MLCMSLRDLATTRIDRTVPALLIGTFSAAGVAAGGLALVPLAPWPMPSAEAAGLVAAAGVFVAAGFYCMVQAMRLGEVSAVVNSHHHQALEKIGEGLQASAWSSDGLVEAVEDSDAEAAVHPIHAAELVLRQPHEGERVVGERRQVPDEREGPAHHREAVTRRGAAIERVENVQGAQ